MSKERRKISDSFLSLWRGTQGNIPQEYLKPFHVRFEDGQECWLDLVPLVTNYSNIESVVDWFSYLNPKFFPDRNSIHSIDFSKLSGGKGRRCTKGIQLSQPNQEK